LGRSTTFVYDDMNRRRSRTMPAVSGQPAAVETFVTNDVGNMDQHVTFNGVTVTMAYDSMNRLKSKTPDNGEPVVAFTYSPTGQR